MTAGVFFLNLQSWLAGIPIAQDDDFKFLDLAQP